MSFLGQSIRNNFPLWSKIRKDDSSIGAITFDVFGEHFEEIRVEILRRSEQEQVMRGKSVFEPGFLYTFYLNESLEFSLYQDENREFKSLSATATKGAEEYELRSLFSYSDLCKSYPTRYEVELVTEEDHYLLTTVEKSNVDFAREKTEEFFFEKYPGRIYINVFDSEEYEISTYNENMSDNKYVVLRGKNIFNKRVEEKITIENDLFYESKNIFKSLENLEEDSEKNIAGGSSISCYGFDGTVEILKYPLQPQKKVFPFKILIKKNDDLNYKESLEENIGYFSLKNNEESESTYTKLQYIFHSYEFAKDYLNARTNVGKDFFEQILLEQNILNENLEEVFVEDFTFDYLRNKLVTIDASGKVSWYEVKPNHFFRPEIERTKRTNITFESEKQRVSLNETLQMYFSLERAKGTISQVLIARKSPSQKREVVDANQELIRDFNFDYLQEDLTWSRDKNFFRGRDDDDVYLAFEGKTVESTFEEYGQYDFYIFSFASNFEKTGALQSFINGDITETEFKGILNAALEDEYQESILIDTYSVICESLIPEITIETELNSLLVANGEEPENFSFGIFFDNPENDLFVLAASDSKSYLYKIKQYRDYIIFDYGSGSGAVLEEYDSVNLNINQEFEEEINYNG